MQIIQLDDYVAVAAQISAGDVPRIAAAGYRVLLNNRPDGEEGGQPAASEIAAAAAAAGLEYHHLPVTAGDFPGAGFEQISDLMNDPERPVLAFCRSGTRCANLWLASREASEREQAHGVALGKGFDLAMAAAYLARG